MGAEERSQAKINSVTESTWYRLRGGRRKPEEG